jgi:hypothetical protein
MNVVNHPLIFKNFPLKLIQNYLNFINLKFNHYINFYNIIIFVNSNFIMNFFILFKIVYFMINISTFDSKENNEQNVKNLVLKKLDI